MIMILNLNINGLIYLIEFLFNSVVKNVQLSLSSQQNVINNVSISFIECFFKS